MDADRLLGLTGLFLLIWLVLDVCVSIYTAWVYYRLRCVQAALLRELQRAERLWRQSESNRSD